MKSFSIAIGPFWQNPRCYILIGPFYSNEIKGSYWLKLKLLTSYFGFLAFLIKFFKNISHAAGDLTPISHDKNGFTWLAQIKI